MLICINTHPAAFFLQAVESISSDSAGEPIKEEHVTLTNTPTQKPKVHRDGECDLVGLNSNPVTERLVHPEIQNTHHLPSV